MTNNNSKPCASKQNIPYVDLCESYLRERQEILDICDNVFKSGRLVLGQALWDLEADLSNYLGGSEVIALRSGTDALILALKAANIGAGDEVITAPNSFVATAGAIVAVGAFPRFVDVREDMNLDPALVETAITPKTKAIIPVHLTGRIAPINEISRIAAAHNLIVIEDAAQAIGAKYNNQLAGTFGSMGCFSAHPLKNLAAAGDAGFLVVNKGCDIDTDKIRYYRNHGLQDREYQTSWGVNCRLDVLQCRILSHRLKSLDQLNMKRRELATFYGQYLDSEFIQVPTESDEEYNVYHTYTVKVPRREEVQSLLKESGIGTAIHYPTPIHLQPPSRKLGYKPGDFPVTEKLAREILSLPIQPHLEKQQIIKAAKTLNRVIAKLLQ